jgi:hypothetical protein
MEALAARMIGALIVFVPLVLAAFIALEVVAPTFVSVREPAVLERVYPELPVVENVRPWTVMLALKSG